MASIGTEFMDYYRQQRLRALVGIDDWTDRLNYFYSVIIISVCISVVTVKTYFLAPLACHCPTVPTGAKFGSFLTETCFTQGTIPLRKNETLPQSKEEWNRIGEERLRNYYYWVPFMLGLQLILFYLPDLIWRCLTYNKLGINLQTLIDEANKARECVSVEDRRKKTEKVAESLRLVLFEHRNLNEGLWSDMKTTVARFCGFFICSKRLGTDTIASYLFIKLLYLVNGVGQIYMMRHFLGFDKYENQNLGLELLTRVRMKDEWRDTLYFPRLAFCRVEIRLLGAQNSYVALCALPVNMFNEKIYMFLWFWVIFVTTCTAMSVPLWLFSLASRKQSMRNLKLYFRMEKLQFDEEEETNNPYKKDPMNSKHMLQFIDEFLRYDGVFLLQIIYKHVGDLVTGEIVRLLWTAWVKEYAERHDFRYDTWENTRENSLLNNAEASMPDYSHGNSNAFPNAPSHRASSINNSQLGFNNTNNRRTNSVKSEQI